MSGYSCFLTLRCINWYNINMVVASERLLAIGLHCAWHFIPNGWIQLKHTQILQEMWGTHQKNTSPSHIRTFGQAGLFSMQYSTVAGHTFWQTRLAELVMLHAVLLLPACSFVLTTVTCKASKWVCHTFAWLLVLLACYLCMQLLPSTWYVIW